jgi:hypothetical protein
MAMLELRTEFAAQLPSGVDAFEYLMHLDGEIFRDIASRRTLRFTLNDKRYFLKAHYGVGWSEIFKNLLTLRLPVLGARNEWLAIRKLEQLGIDTMHVVAYGERGRNPARRQSFIVTEALEDTESLEEFCADWDRQPPASPAALRLKRSLIRRVARIARAMHTHGINHRDFYICHLLLDVSRDVLAVDPDTLPLSLIDLHRAQIRNRTPRRWIIKDIGALYFSAMRIGLTRRDLYRFMTVYRDAPLRETLAADGKFWSRCRLRAASLYHSFYHELPANP